MEFGFYTVAVGIGYSKQRTSRSGSYSEYVHLNCKLCYPELKASDK